MKRIARRDSYTIGHLYIDGQYFCDTCEDTDRGLRQDLPLSVNQAKKRRGVTAIPVGRYRVTLGVKSQKYSKKKQESVLHITQQVPVLELKRLVKEDVILVFPAEI